MTDSSTTNDGSDDVNQTEAVEITYEIGDNELPSEAVVRATAALMDMSVIELDPLFDAVEPDRLDGLFDDSGEAARLRREFSDLHLQRVSCRGDR